MAIRNIPLKMGGQQIQGLGDAVDATDAVNKGQLDAAVAAVDLSLYAPLAGPTFTGDPKAPTPATADNDTSIATTAYVKSNLATYATLASPALTGVPTAPTASASDDSTQIATTAFVKDNISWTVLSKSADQSITSNATLSDDTHLQFSMAANTTYNIKACYSVTVGAGGLKISCNGPSTPTKVMIAGIIGNATSTVNNQAGALVIAYGNTFWNYTGGGASMVFHIEGVIQNGANAGTFAMQIAQSSSNASATAFEKGSWLEYRAI